MITPSVAIVRMAASLLPAHSRARYREQWLGELRDAPELGIQPSEIAAGSIAFAMTHGRALPSLGPVRAESVIGRARLAVALSLSAAAIAISQFVNVWSGGLTGNAPYDFTMFAASMFLTLVVILAPLVALFLAFATSGVASRIRIAVVLLVLASVVPVFANLIDRPVQFSSSPWPFTAGAVVYPLAIVLVAGAAVVVWRELRPLQPSGPRQRRMPLLLTSVAGGVLVAIATSLAFSHAVDVWQARPTLAFGLPFTESNRASFEQWLTFKVQFETLVSTVLGVWLVASILIAVAAALFGLSRWATIRRIVALIAAAFCIFLLAYGSILGLINLVSPEIATNEPVEAMLVSARWILVVVVLVTVAGPRWRAPLEVAPA